jgi:YidC/Oxa1 family membrane protein insertase
LAEFNNPQQEPGMERRLLLVFALTFIVILLFQPLIKKYAPQPPSQHPTSSTQQSPSQEQPAVNTPTPENLAALPSAKASAPASVLSPKQAATESEIVVESSLYRIVFTNRGGQAKSWVLKKWDDLHGQPLDLVDSAAAGKYGYPLSLWTYDETLRNKLATSLYILSSDDLAKAQSNGGVLTAPTKLTFEYSDGDTSVRKAFEFHDSYVVDVSTVVEQKGAQVTAFPMWPSGFGGETTAASYALTQVAYQHDSNVERLSIKKISGGNTISGPFDWAGVSEQYFAAIFLPKDPENSALVTLRNQIEVAHNVSDPKSQLDRVDVLGAAVGNLKGPSTGRLYVGPKALSDLESVSVPGIVGASPDLRAVVDFGWLGLIARPLFLWLKWTYNHMVANWGWAILLQTLIINLALLPLRFSQMKSMLKMQRVAPQIKSIQEKYKKYSLRDPRKADMNNEISALYKKEGVNPLGGCLPMLLPLFLLWPYYRMLTVAIDLRHASWLWIHDLSAADPYHILPIGIIVTMFLMQRMTPQAGMDPAQQRMMNFMMPAMLGYMSWYLPAGLCLYWAAGQVIGMGQQALVNRTSIGREMREMMAKRARKKEK